MGFGGIGVWQLLIVLAIILLLFGTKKLKNLGGDLGGAIKGFKKSMKDVESKKEEDSKSEASKLERSAEEITKTEDQKDKV